MKARLRGLFGVFLMISAGYSRETWLAPERFTATPGATLRFELMRSESFYGSEGMWPVGAVLNTRGTLAGEAVSLGPVTGGEKKVSFSATLSRPGLAVVWAEMEPAIVEREPEQAVAHLLRSHVGEADRAILMDGQPRQVWRERVSVRAKTAVYVGEPDSSDKSWSQPITDGLDLVVVGTVNEYRVGDALLVKVQRTGLPAEGLAVGFVLAGEGRESVVFSGAEGEATVRLDASGMWLIYCRHTRRSSEADVDWVTEFVTLVIEAK
jgi:hypothetical protein